MATPKIWDRSRTRADDGFMHAGSMDTFRSSYYASAIEADNIEDEAHWMFALFHGPEWCESNLKDVFRPNIRSGVSLGTTNYMTQSHDIGDHQSLEAFDAFVDMIVRLMVNDRFDRVMTAVLAFYIVGSGLNQFLVAGDVSSAIDQQLAKDIEYFESVQVGSENKENWSGRVTKRLSKVLVWEYVGCTKSCYYSTEYALSEIARNVFGDSPF